MNLWNRLRSSEHERIRDLLSPYLDGEVTEQERVLVEQHLLACSGCAAELESLRWTVGLLAQVPAEPLPRSFVLRRAEVEPAPSPLRLPWLYPLLHGATVVAALLLVAVLTLDFGLGWWAAPAASPSAQQFRAAKALVSPEAEGIEEAAVSEEKTAESAGQPPGAELAATRQTTARAPVPSEDQVGEATALPGIVAQEALTTTALQQTRTSTPPPSPAATRVAQATPPAGLLSATQPARNPWRTMEISLVILLVLLAGTTWWLRGGGL